MNAILQELAHKRAGKAVEQIRKEAGLTQQDLANLSGIDRSRISRIETGEQVNSRRLNVLARALNSAEISWWGCCLCDGILAIPVLNQEVINTEFIAVLTKLVTELEEAAAAAQRALVMLLNKTGPESILDADKAVLNKMLEQSWELIPCILQISVSTTKKYQYDYAAGNKLVWKILQERRYVENFSEKEKAHTMAG